MAETEWLDGVPVFTVSQFANTLDKVLRQTFSEGAWVEGEIQGLRFYNPHCYFTLIEEAPNRWGKQEKYQLNVNLFKDDLVTVKKKLKDLGAELKEGMRVRLYGVPGYHGPNGKLGLTVSNIDSSFAAGDLAQKREALIKKLHENGTLALNKARKVPVVPLRLGVISSSQAAGLADAMKHLSESGYGFSVTMLDVRVQGEAAAPMIVNALRTFSRSRDIDLVLLMRGGGSKSDLAVFDDERIALAISECTHPVFTGIGHVIDQSVADLAAHTEAKTPTACVDAVIEHVDRFLARLDNNAQRIRSATARALEGARGRVRLAQERMVTRARAAVVREEQRLELHAAKVRLLDPATTLARGWSITRAANGSVVRSVADIAPGQTLTTQVADGTITSTVNGTNKQGDN